MQKSIKDFLYEIEVLGFSVFENVVSAQLLERLRHDVEKHENRCKLIYKKNGITEGMEGCAHHIFGTDDSIDEFLYMFYHDDYIRAFLTLNIF